MQILQKGYYELKSKRNSVKKIEKIPVRGLFLDRNKKLLVNNLPSYTIFITKEGYDKNQNKLLEAAMGLEDGYINKFLEKNKRYSKYLQLRFKRGVSFNTISWIEENMEHLPGISYKVEMHRGYPANVTGAQMFGYLNEISQKQLNKFQKKYKLGDFIGSTGLEKKYENLLKFLEQIKDKDYQKLGIEFAKQVRRVRKNFVPCDGESVGMKDRDDIKEKIKELETERELAEDAPSQDRLDYGIYLLNWMLRGRRCSDV